LGASSGCSAEPVVVGKAQPLIGTTPSAGGTVGVARSEERRVGEGFGPLTGTVGFNLIAPGDTSCATSIGSSVGTISGGSASSGTATSGSYAAAAVGTYLWTAPYCGDANNLGASSGCSAEPVVVGKAQPLIGTTPSAGGTVGVA